MKTEILKEGDVVEGRITGIQAYGIFIKLNSELSGLIHTSELEKLEINNPDRYFKIGQNLRVKILRIKPGGKQAVLRINRDANARKRVGAANFETKSGFLNLKKQLAIWVEDEKSKMEAKKIRGVRNG